MDLIDRGWLMVVLNDVEGVSAELADRIACAVQEECPSLDGVFVMSAQDFEFVCKLGGIKRGEMRDLPNGKGSVGFCWLGEKGRIEP